jgi:amino acid adenylation domain-containing protein
MMMRSTCDLQRETTNWIQFLDETASRDPNRLAFRFVNDSGDRVTDLSYGDLSAAARGLAAEFQASAKPGDRVLLLHPNAADLIKSFFGCLYAGLIAVPAPSPRGKRGLERLAVIVDDAEPVLVLTNEAALRQLQSGGRFDGWPTRVKWMATDTLALRPEGWRRPALRADSIAFLQYTSGSTADPRGVILTHQNLLVNSEAIKTCFGHDGSSKGVICLPLHHDMGLVGGVLQAIYLGTSSTILSPLTVIRSPIEWLRWLSREQGSTSGGPNFLFEQCIKKVTPDQISELDLSHWKVAFCGAEPIQADTLNQFAEKFAPCGFRREAFLPCYGLAETTLLATAPIPHIGAAVSVFDADALEQGLAVSANGHGRRRWLVSCGQAAPGSELVIADPQTGRRCNAGQIGEVWLAGPSIARGYWRKPTATEATFQARLTDCENGTFLRTGDLGFVRDGELYVTGRLKELLIIRGRNYYPQDIEAAIRDSHDALNGAVCAFARDDQSAGTVIVAEIARSWLDKIDEIRDDIVLAIREAVAESCELGVEAIALVRPESLPKTTSGKLRRVECRDRYCNEELDVVALVAPDAAEPGDVPATLVDSPGNLTADEGVIHRLRASLAPITGARVWSFPADVPLSRLGLDSLMVMESLVEIEREFGVRLPIDALFRPITIADLAARVGGFDNRNGTHHGELHVTNAQEFPLSPNQKALWFIHELTGDTAAYTVPFAIRLPGKADSVALRQTFETIVARHPSLRTTFGDSGDGVVQRVRDDLPLDFQTIDATGWTDAVLESRIAAEIASPFDLRQTLPIRLRLYQRETDSVLLLAIHHIVVDFGSFQLLLKELERVFAAVVAGQEADLIPAGNYASHVSSLAEFLRSDSGKRQEAYWHQQLAGELPVLSLPLDRPRPSVQTSHGSAVNIPIEPELLAQLEAVARDRDASLFMVLLAAYDTLLHFLSGQDDLLVGVPFSGRTKAEQFPIVGYFVNPLPLRIRIGEGETFADVLKNVRQSTLDAMANQDFPSALLANRVSTARDASQATLFQTMFVLNRVDRDLAGRLTVEPDGSLALPIGQQLFERFHLKHLYTKFDLVLAGLQIDNRLELSLQYNVDLFEPATAMKFGGYLANLLREIARDPDRRLSSISIMSDDERRQLLAVSAGVAVDYPTRCFHEEIEAWAHREPGRVALEFGNRRLTFGELNGWANQVASALRDHGIGRGAVVPIYMERSPELVVAELGIVKAGAAFFPLDVQWPSARTQAILKSASPPVVLTDPSLQQRANVFELPVIVVRQPENAASFPNLDLAITLDDPVYVFSTSGSTGTPKAAMVAHRGLTNRFGWMNDFFGKESAKSALQTTRHVYDSSVWQFFWPMTNGGKTVLPDDDILTADTITRLISRHEVTITDFVPSVFNALVPQLVTKPAVVDSLRTLRSVVVGGEEITPSTTYAFMDQFPGVKVANLYGPTETTIGCIAHEVKGRASGKIPIGRPISNVTILILNRDRQLVPMGCVGEIYITGAALGLGYLNDPVATERVFVKYPFAEVPHAMMYKTGDLAKWRSDGTIDFLGRVDFQIKIRGLRVEPAEIEAALGEHPAVRSAIVIAHKPKLGVTQLIAYVARAEGKEVAPAELSALAREKLPAFMVPSEIFVMDKFPLTAGGKLNRAALPAPRGIDRSASFVAPRTPLEQEIVAQWSAVLGGARVGIRDNFFELGGDSLMAMQLISRLRDHFKISLPLRDLFADPTPEAVANAVMAARDRAVESPIPRSESIDHRNALDLLSRLDSLTDAEADELLAALSHDDDGGDAMDDVDGQE